MTKTVGLMILAVLLSGCSDKVGATNGDVGQAIADHAAQPAAHHAKTVDAGELTAGVLSPDRLPIRPRSIPLNVMGAFLAGGATVAQGFGGGVLMPDAGNPQIAFAFTVPDDFADTNLTLRVNWTGAAGCGFYLRPNYVAWTRLNTAPQSAGSVSAGLVDPGVETPSSAMGASVSELTMAAPGGVTGWNDILPGDSIHFGLYRTVDSCTGSVSITSAALLYDAKF